MKRNVKKEAAQQYYYLNRDPASLNGEEWKAIKGFEDMYEVSNFGRVRSIPKVRDYVFPKRATISYRTEETVLRQAKQKYTNLYLKIHVYSLSVHLYRGKTHSTFMVARLVYEHFGPASIPLTNDQLVFHRDGNGLNNHIDNLFTGDQLEIQLHRIKPRGSQVFLADRTDT